MAFGFARAVGRALISGLSKAGRSASAAYQAVKRRGYGYREHTMRQDISQIYSRMEREGPTRKYPGDVTPDRGIMTETELRQPERNYRIFGEVEYYDWDAREWSTKNVSFYDDYLRTKEEWQAEFVRNFGDVYARQYSQTIYGMNIYAIEHNRGHLY